VTLAAREKLAIVEAKGGRNVKREWLAPLTGVAFVALVVLGSIIGGEPPGADDPVQEIVDHYTDNEDSVIAGAILVAFGAVFLIFFAGYLRRVLSAAEGEGGVLSAVSLVGAAVMAVGIAIDSTISFALAEAVEDIEPTAVQALQALWDSDFIPIAVGAVVFLLSAGISIARHAALPKWLGWVAILLAVLGLTPIGFIAFIGAGIWILIISVMLAIRARAATV
jgi:hypothetical protein